MGHLTRILAVLSASIITLAAATPHAPHTPRGLSDPNTQTSTENAPRAIDCSAITVTMEPRIFTELHAERVKIKYGPFGAPSQDQHGGMTAFECAAPPPCADCMVTWMQAGLEYTNGSVASAEDGMWLHHSVWRNMGRPDPLCPDRPGERFFASGNEITPIDLTSNGTNRFGYPFHSQDELHFLNEIMNTDNFEKEVVLTMTWEFVPSPSDHFHRVRPYWFDVGGCDGSTVTALPNATFQFSSPSVKVATPGMVAVAGGHLHDGGTHIEVFKGDSVICKSEALYSDDGHIVHQTLCDQMLYAAEDEMYITAYYDTKQHAPMTFPDGQLEDVMGIAMLFSVEGDFHKKPVDSPAEEPAAGSTTKNMGGNALFGILVVGSTIALGSAIRWHSQRVKRVLVPWLPGWIPLDTRKREGEDADGRENLLTSDDREE